MKKFTTLFILLFLITTEYAMSQYYEGGGGISTSEYSMSLVDVHSWTAPCNIPKDEIFNVYIAVALEASYLFGGNWRLKWDNFLTHDIFQGGHFDRNGATYIRPLPTQYLDAYRRELQKHCDIKVPKQEAPSPQNNNNSYSHSNSYDSERYAATVRGWTTPITDNWKEAANSDTDFDREISEIEWKEEKTVRMQRKAQLRGKEEELSRHRKIQ